MLRHCIWRAALCGSEALSQVTLSVAKRTLIRGCGIATETFRLKCTTPPRFKTMKIDSPEFHALFTPELKKLVELFEKYKHELRIAGGAVRDLLLGNQPHDVDFATTATPAEMKTLFDTEGIRMINTRGESHGTITCRMNDKENFEVTTLRIDVVTDGRHAEVAFTKDWELDAERRDLTVNSLFLGFDGTVYDYFNGIQDLENRKVKFVGDAVSRIQEDYLRILRYFRFYGKIAQVAGDHDAATLAALRDNMKGLAGISGERIWVELKKILAGRFAAHLVTLMLDLGMGPYIGLPEQPNTTEFSRVWESCHDLDPLPLTLLPALMKTEEDVQKLNMRLKMSKDEVQLGLFIVSHRADDMNPDPFQYCQDLLCDSTGKDVKTKARTLELLKYHNQRQTLQRMKDYHLPRFPITGHRLVEKGVGKGPIFAKTLAALRQKWKESRFKMTEDELVDYIDELKETIK